MRQVIGDGAQHTSRRGARLGLAGLCAVLLGVGLLAPSRAGAAESWAVTAPGRDGPVAHVHYDEGAGTVSVSVSRNETTVMEPSPVGLRTEHADLSSGLETEVPVTGTSWDVPATDTTTVHLEAGTNTVKIYNDDAHAPDLDRIRIADPNA